MDAILIVNMNRDGVKSFRLSKTPLLMVWLFSSLSQYVKMVYEYMGRFAMQVHRLDVFQPVEENCLVMNVLGGVQPLQIFVKTSAQAQILIM